MSISGALFALGVALFLAALAIGLNRNRFGTIRGAEARAILAAGALGLVMVGAALALWVADAQTGLVPG